MTGIKELRGRAADLRVEALALLNGGVGDALRHTVGEVEIAGSVALDLMVWRDIDLYTRLERSDAPRLLAAIPQVAAELAHAGQPVSRISYRDEHLDPDPAFPATPGLYLGLITAGGWKIDLWGWDSERYSQQRLRHHELATAIARADRDLVLRLKDELWRRPDYRSVDVYDFVLANAGSSLTDFDRFRSRGDKPAANAAE